MRSIKLILFFGIACLLCGSAYPFSLEAFHIKNAEQFDAIPTVGTIAYDYLKSAPKLTGTTSTRFIIVRHAQSVSNKEKVIAGRSIDSDLSPEGVIQALQVGEKLASAGVSINATYSSPSIRAMKTASIITGALGVAQQPEIDDRLYERYFGPFEGVPVQVYMTNVEGESKYACGAHIPFVEKMNFKYHTDMESYADTQNRFVEFLQSILKNHAGETVLVATHGAVMKSVFMADAYAKGYEVDYQVFNLDNCSILVIEADASGRQINATSELTFRN